MMEMLGVTALESQIAALHAKMAAAGALPAGGIAMPEPIVGCNDMSAFDPALHASQVSSLANQMMTPKSTRWNIRDSDLQLLEVAFSMDNFPSSFVRQQLATELNVSCRQVQVWFQNRRQRTRNKTKGDDDGGATDAKTPTAKSSDDMRVKPVDSSPVSGKDKGGCSSPTGDCAVPKPEEISKLISRCQETSRAADELISSLSSGCTKAKGKDEANAPKEAPSVSQTPTPAVTEEKVIAVKACERPRVVAARVVAAPVSKVTASRPTTTPPVAAQPVAAKASDLVLPRHDRFEPESESLAASAKDDSDSDSGVGAKRSRRGKTKSEARAPGALDLLMSQRQQAQTQSVLIQMMQQVISSGGQLPTTMPMMPPPSPSLTSESNGTNASLAAMLSCMQQAWSGASTASPPPTSPTTLPQVPQSQQPSIQLPALAGLTQATLQSMSPGELANLCGNLARFITSMASQQTANAPAQQTANSPANLPPSTLQGALHSSAFPAYTKPAPVPAPPASALFRQLPSSDAGFEPLAKLRRVDSNNSAFAPSSPGSCHTTDTVNVPADVSKESGYVSEDVSFSDPEKDLLSEISDDMSEQDRDELLSQLSDVVFDALYSGV